MERMTRVTGKYDHDVPLQRSIPKRNNSLASEGPEEETEIWRITWSRRVSAQNAYPETELFSTRSDFEQRLFGLVLEAEGEQRGQRNSLKYRWWRDLFKARQKEAGKTDGEESRGRVDKVTRVEKLTPKGWQLYSFGMMAPELYYVPQEDS